MSEKLTENNFNCDCAAPLSQRLHNEWTAITTGLARTPGQMGNAVTHALENPGETGLKVGIAGTFGLVLGYAAKSPGKLGLVAKGFGAAAGVAFLADGVKPLYDATKTAWYANSQQEVDRAANILATGTGRFAVDTIIQTPFGVAGSLAGSRLSGMVSLARASKVTEVELPGSSVTTAKPVTEQQLLKTTEPPKSPVAESLPAVELTTTTTNPVRLTEGRAQGQPLSNQVEALASSNKGGAPAAAESTKVRSGETDRPVAVKPEGSIAAVPAKPAFEPRILNIVDMTAGNNRTAKFDMAIGLTAKDQKAGLTSSNQRPSLTLLEAATMDMPSSGTRLAIRKGDPETLISVALLQNRMAGRENDWKLVELLVNPKAEPPKGSGSQILMNHYNAISRIAGEAATPVATRLRYLQSALRLAMNGEQLKGYASDRAPAVGKIENPEILNTLRVAIEKPATQPAQTMVPGETNRTAVTLSTKSQEAVSPRSAAEEKVFAVAPEKPSYEIGIGTYRTASRFDFLVGARLETGKPYLPFGSAMKAAIELPAQSLPQAGSKIGVVSMGKDSIVAAAILKNRISGKANDRSLLEFIENPETGTLPQRLYNGLKTANRAIDGAIQHGTTIEQKVRQVASILNREMPLDQKLELSAKAESYSPSAIARRDRLQDFYSSELEPPPFKYITVHAAKQRDFDFGIEITNPRLLKRGQPNLDHHGMNVSAEMPSAAQQAVSLPAKDVPKVGSVIATVTPDADAVTGMAVLHNRALGKPVNAAVVDAIGRRDRGFHEFEAGTETPALRDAFNSIRSISRNEQITLEQRVGLIGKILSGEADPKYLTKISRNYENGVAERMDRALANTTVSIAVPGKLSVVETTKPYYYEARQIGQEKAPVTLVTQSDVTHYTIVATPLTPETQYLGRALARLNKIDPGWVGRQDIFLSGRSHLTREQVTGLLAEHVAPTRLTKVKWAWQDNYQPQLSAQLESLRRATSGMGSYLSGAPSKLMNTLYYTSALQPETSLKRMSPFWHQDLNPVPAY